MNYLQHIGIRGFRRLKAIDLELRPLCALIGANGSGKTSLLEVFSLLAAAAEGKLNQKISSFGGMASIVTSARSETQPSLSIETSMRSSDAAPLEYRLVLETQGVGYVIAEELCTQKLGEAEAKQPFVYFQGNRQDVQYFGPEQRWLDLGLFHNPLETALFQVPKLYRDPQNFYHHLASLVNYHSLPVDPNSPVRVPQQIAPAMLPGHDGQNLTSCLYNLRETSLDRFEIIQDVLRAAFPGFERLDFPPVAAGMLAMAWRDRNFSRPFYMHQLSEGTLRFLWLATLLQSPGLPAITLIDEPEVSLHPELLSVLADLFREASARTQLIVATHSDRLVRFLEPHEVVAFDVQEDGSAQATWADTFDLEEWLKDYTLDELWRLGRMGGRA